jgi:predicted aldo/keto reductase-like oxidoreductase
MRYGHYFSAQGREKLAMQKYAALPGTGAAVCMDCAGHCEAACPYQVPVRSLLSGVHQNLTLA